MKYDPKMVKQGRLNQQRATETPSSFTTEGGATVVTNSSDIGKSQQRMAGQQGARAMEMMNDPEEKARTSQWMQLFSTTNQGMQWNQAKMGGPPPA